MLSRNNPVLAESTRLNGRYCNTTKNMFKPIGANSSASIVPSGQIHKHILTLAAHIVTLLWWEGMKLLHHPTIQNLMLILLCNWKFWPCCSNCWLFDLPCLDPCASAQCPLVGSDCMAQIPGAWVYLWSKACHLLAHEQSSSCCVKLLVMSLWYFHIPNYQWVDMRSGTLRGVIQIWV